MLNNLIIFHGCPGAWITLILGYFWIGASDLMVENEWRWLNSDRPLDYANWPPGEPNNSGGNENCVEIKVTAWNDCPCASLNWYICEKSRYNFFLFQQTEYPITPITPMMYFILVYHRSLKKKKDIPRIFLDHKYIFCG